MLRVHTWQLIFYFFGFCCSSSVHLKCKELVTTCNNHSIFRNKCKGGEGWILTHDLIFSSPQYKNHENIQACIDLWGFLKTKGRANPCPLPSSLLGKPAEITCNIIQFAAAASYHGSSCIHLWQIKAWRGRTSPARSRMHHPFTTYSPRSHCLWKQQQFQHVFDQG